MIMSNTLSKNSRALQHVLDLSIAYTPVLAGPARTAVVYLF
jgi:hypothetical protein